MSDRLLREAEDASADSGDVDAGTLDEVIERVMADYTAMADARLDEAEATHAVQMANAEAAASARAQMAEDTARNAVEEMRRRDLRADGIARRWSRRGGTAFYWSSAGLVLVATGWIALNNPFEASWVGGGILIAVVVLTVLELVGALGQLREARQTLENWLYRRIRKMLVGDASATR